MAPALPRTVRNGPAALHTVGHAPPGLTVNLTHWTALELVLLAGALAVALLVRPWQLLRAGPSGAEMATPLLAAATLLPWLWAWPGSAAMPVPLQWSGAALAVLVLGWPLAVPVLVAAGLSTVLSAGASWSDALAGTVWLGMVPATAVLLLGHAVRRTFGTHPAAYLLGRAFAVPLLTLFASRLLAAFAGQGLPATDAETQVVAAFLLAIGETTWTCAVVSILVACRPQWLATWSDTLYLEPRRAARRA